MAEKHFQKTTNPSEIILQFIKDNPSIHIRKIKRELGFSMGTIQYHILRLEKTGVIRAKREGFYKNYYHIGELEQEEGAMSMLNIESPRRILLFLLENQPSTHGEIAKGVGLTSSTISWHMKKLVEKQIIELKYDGKFSVYAIKNKEEILKLLSRYKSSTWNDMISNLAETFTAFQE